VSLRKFIKNEATSRGVVGGTKNETDPRNDEIFVVGEIQVN
jgi:hypothetical protein